MAHREYVEYFRTMEKAKEWEDKFRDGKDRDEYIVVSASKSNSVIFTDTQEPAYVVKWEKYS